MSENNLTKLPTKKRSHGIGDHPLYPTWKNMRYRCNRREHKHFHQYGGRGIRVCERWNNSFRDWLADMGERPEGRYSIDRINNERHYSCGKCQECLHNGWDANCKWSTQLEQTNNTKRNVLLTLNGKTQSLSQWAVELGIRRSTLQGRMVDGWSDRDVLTIPVEQNRGRFRLGHKYWQHQ